MIRLFLLLKLSLKVLSSFHPLGVLIVCGLTVVPLEGKSQSLNSVNTMRSNSQERLPSITVSGISSGAFMALQMQIVHSKDIQGAVIMAGGPAACALDRADLAVKVCMKNPQQILEEGPIGKRHFDLMVENTLELSRSTLLVDGKTLPGNIDDLKHLTGKNISLYHGSDDTVIKSEMMNLTKTYLQKLNPDVSLRATQLPGTAHTWPTLEDGNPCLNQESPFIGKCSLDFAKEIFANFYTNLKEKSQKSREELLAHLHEITIATPPFSFSEMFSRMASGTFIFGGPSISTKAYLYVPESCSSGSCPIHVAFHGCQMSSERIGKTFVEKSGLIEWADTNQTVVYFPQVRDDNPKNPYGCWDWWGYTGAFYATRDGPQIKELWREVLAIPQFISNGLSGEL